MLDTEDERTIANQLEREEKREKEPTPEPQEVTESKKDATLPVCATTSLRSIIHLSNNITGQEPRQRAQQGRQDRPGAPRGGGGRAQEEGHLRSPVSC